MEKHSTTCIWVVLVNLWCEGVEASVEKRHLGSIAESRGLPRRIHRANVDVWMRTLIFNKKWNRFLIHALPSSAILLV